MYKENSFSRHKSKNPKPLLFRISFGFLVLSTGIDGEKIPDSDEFYRFFVRFILWLL